MQRLSVKDQFSLGIWYNRNKHKVPPQKGHARAMPLSSFQVLNPSPDLVLPWQHSREQS